MKKLLLFVLLNCLFGCLQLQASTTVYDLTAANPDLSRFSWVGDWQHNLNEGHPGLYNFSGGFRDFTIGNLSNGDQITITYTRYADGGDSSYDAGTFVRTNNSKGTLFCANASTGVWTTTSTVVESGQTYTLLEDGELTLNFHRYVSITNITITHPDDTPAIAFSQHSFVEQQVGVEFEEPTLSTHTPSTAMVLYSSSNTNVATVNAYTGELTLLDEGNVTITARMTVGGVEVSDAYSIRVAGATVVFEDYSFMGSGGNVEIASAGTRVINGNTVTILNFTNQTYGSTTYQHPNNRFGVVNALTGNKKWFLYSSGTIDGLYSYFSGNRDFYILDLKNGDKVTIWYTVNNNGGTTTVKSPNTSLAVGTAIGNAEKFSITEDGNLLLSVGRYTGISFIRIEHETVPEIAFSQTSCSYELTDFNFAEPTLTVRPSGAGVVYSSSDETIAQIADSNGEVMFLNTTTADHPVRITATMTINGVDYSAYYDVSVKADAATYEATSDTYTLTGSGKLLEHIVTEIPFIHMAFGTPFQEDGYGNDTNVTIVRNFGTEQSPYFAATGLDSDGWEHMYFSVDMYNGTGYIRPLAGSCYTFYPAIDGTLRIKGKRKKTGTGDNTVVMVDWDEDNTTDPYDTNNTEVAQNVIFKIKEGATYQSGQQVEITAADKVTVAATITFGESGGADFNVGQADSNLYGYEAYTSGNNTNGNQSGGTFYTIVPKYSGTMEIGVMLNAGKSFYILEDGEAMEEFDNVTVEQKYYGTFSFNVTANKTYKVYAAGSKLGFYGFKLFAAIPMNIRSYPIVKTLTFNSGESDAVEEDIALKGGHVYFLYANTGESNGGTGIEGGDAWQVFYLNQFKFTTNFTYPHKAVVMTDNSGVSAGYTRTPISTNYLQTISNTTAYDAITYSKEEKGNITANINSTTGELTDISGEGSIVVTASFTQNAHVYKTSYVLTKPYTTTGPKAVDGIVTWTFADYIGNTQQMETKTQLQQNTSDWGMVYKVREYDQETRMLRYINVPVLSNNSAVDGDNARFFDNTAGLLFTANAKSFGTNIGVKDIVKDQTFANAKELDAALRKMLNYSIDDVDSDDNPVVYEETNNVTIANGATLTIPDLKQGQYIRIKWQRYAENIGDWMIATNVTDLEGTSMTGRGFYVGNGANNGKFGYLEFMVEADGDVTFTRADRGWTNLISITISDQFVPSDYRLRDSNVAVRDLPTAYIRKVNGTTFTQPYSTSYGIDRHTSSLQTAYRVKEDTRTGTLTAENCTITDTGSGFFTLTAQPGAHGRFTLVQEGRNVTSDYPTGYLLDRCEYVIKVYEYDVTQKTYPHTWNLQHITTDTGNHTATEMATDAAKAANTYPYWTAPSGEQAADNYYTLNVGNPENVLSFSKKDNVGTSTMIPELDGLGIIPDCYTTDSNQNIRFSSSGAGLQIASTTEAQELVVPGVQTGQTVYLAIEHDGSGIVAAGTAENVLTPERTVNGLDIFTIAGDGEDVNLYLTNLTVKTLAVSSDTKSVSAAGYATEARNYPLDFTLAETFLGNEQIAYIVTGTDDGAVTLTQADYVPASSGVMITGISGEASSWPLFTTDVDRLTSDVSENKLVGVVEQPAENVDQKTGDKYNYILSTSGYVVRYDGDPNSSTGTVNREANGLGFYLVLKKGTEVNGKPYPGGKPAAHSAYLQLDESLATHQSLLSSQPQLVHFFALNPNNSTTAIDVVETSTPTYERMGIYDLQGRQYASWESLPKGLYIVNGKKVRK